MVYSFTHPRDPMYGFAARGLGFAPATTFLMDSRCDCAATVIGQVRSMYHYHTTLPYSCGPRPVKRHRPAFAYRRAFTVLPIVQVPRIGARVPGNSDAPSYGRIAGRWQGSMCNTISRSGSNNLFSAALGTMAIHSIRLRTTDCSKWQ